MGRYCKQSTSRTRCKKCNKFKAHHQTVAKRATYSSPTAAPFNSTSFLMKLHSQYRQDVEEEEHEVRTTAASADQYGSNIMSIPPVSLLQLKLERLQLVTNDVDPTTTPEESMNIIMQHDDQLSCSGGAGSPVVGIEVDDPAAFGHLHQLDRSVTDDNFDLLLRSINPDRVSIS